MQVSKTCKFQKLSSCQLSPVVCQLSLVVSCLQLSAVSSCQLSPAFSCLQFSAVSSCQLSPCSTSCRFILPSQSCVHIICSEEYHWTMNRSLRLRCRRSEVSTTVLRYYGIQLLGPRSKVLEQIIGRKEKHSFFY